MTLVITTALIGYVLAGAAGVAMAAIAVFVTPCPIVIARALHDRSFAKNLQEKAPVQGVTAAAVEAIAGFVLILGRRSFIDLKRSQLR